MRASELSYLKREAKPSILDMKKREFECFEWLQLTQQQIMPTHWPSK